MTTESAAGSWDAFAKLNLYGAFTFMRRSFGV